MALKCMWCDAPATGEFELRPARKRKAGLVPAYNVAVCDKHRRQLEEQAAQTQSKKAREKHGF